MVDKFYLLTGLEILSLKNKNLLYIKVRKSPKVAVLDCKDEAQNNLE